MSETELDAWLHAGLAVMGIPIEADWVPSIRANLEVSLRHAERVREITLPDDAEQAPVYCP